MVDGALWLLETRRDHVGKVWARRRRPQRPHIEEMKWKVAMKQSVGRSPRQREGKVWDLGVKPGIKIRVQEPGALMVFEVFEMEQEDHSPIYLAMYLIYTYVSAYLWVCVVWGGALSEEIRSSIRTGSILKEQMSRVFGFYHNMYHCLIIVPTSSAAALVTSLGINYSWSLANVGS